MGFFFSVRICLLIVGSVLGFKMISSVMVIMVLSKIGFRIFIGMMDVIYDLISDFVMVGSRIGIMVF